MNLNSFEPAIRHVREFFQDLWFDRTRNVRTAGNMSLQVAGLRTELQGDSEPHQPARPHHIRRALRELPADDLSGYTFIDLGSGKGRSLFVAAEFPFRRIIGVELTTRLHAQAERNLRTFRKRRAACRDIRALHQNAVDFIFPDGNLVLYLFNPFGRETVRQVLEHLVASLAEQPRHAMVVLLWPRCEDMVAGVPGMQLTRKVQEYQIFHIEPADARLL